MNKLLFVAGAFAVIAACDGDIQLGVPAGALASGDASAPDASFDGAPANGAAGADGSTASSFGTCATDGDCGLSTLHCDPSRGVCVECRTSADCPSSDRHACDTTIGRCVGCLVDADCESSERRCETSIHRCVDRCSTERPCSVGTCELATGRCSECTPGTTCTGSEGRVCTSAAICVECTSEANCAGSDDPHCDVLLGRCVRCTSSSECAASQVCDPYSGECRTRDGG